MKHTLLSIIPLLLSLLMSCQESMEDKAARAAADYTRKYCPTPVINYTRTDSVSFNKSTRTYTYYCTFSGPLDDPSVIATHREQLIQLLTSSVRESTHMKPYVEAGFRFQYVCRSEKSPREVLLQLGF